MSKAVGQLQREPSKASIAAKDAVEQRIASVVLEKERSALRLEIVRLLDAGLEGQPLLAELLRRFPGISRNEFDVAMQEAQAFIKGRGEKKATIDATTDHVVNVRRQYNGHDGASYRLDAISGLHWSDVSGGVQAQANRAYLCGYVWCDAAVAGSVAHSCRHGEGPHHVKVCVVKKDNTKVVYAILLRRMEWERRLQGCPFAVDLGVPSPNSDAVETWLAQNCSGQNYTRVDSGWWWNPRAGWSEKWRPRGQQIWFSDAEIAAAFARSFGKRWDHQNQAKQITAAHFMAGLVQPDEGGPGVRLRADKKTR